MNKMKLVLAISILLVSGQGYAAIISLTNTNTEYSAGLFADLQGLEWLTLDETLGVSRSSIEDGSSGNWLNEGWRYASRNETETIVNSIWGGTTDGWSSDNSAGAKWFVDVFGATYQQNDSEFTNLVFSRFWFGDNLECDSSIGTTCEGGVGYADNIGFSISAPVLADGQWNLETTYIADDGPAGNIQDFRGANLGRIPDNNSGPSDATLTELGNLLVRDITPVPTPTTLPLFGIGLVGLGWLRRKTRLTC